MVRLAGFVATVIVAGLGLTPMSASAATPATLYAAVTVAGDGTCSSPANACLPATAVANAQNGDTVLLAAGSYSIVDLTINTSITLSGTPGAARPAITGPNSSVNPIIDVKASNVTVADLSLGTASSAALQTSAAGFSLDGVAVTDNEGLSLLGSATIRDSTFSNIDGVAISMNSTDPLLVITTQIHGSTTGILAGGPLTVTSTTISGDTSDGIADHSPAGTVITVTDSTISDNTIDGMNVNDVDLVSDTITGNGQTGVESHVTGGIEAGANIIAGNSPDCSTTVGHDDGYNIDSDGTCGLSSASSTSSSSTIVGSLTSLASNGGPTQTIGLITHSPAIGLVTGLGHAASGKTYAICGTADERGYPRHKAPCDAGAFQTGAPAPVVTVKLARPKNPTVGNGEMLTATLTGNWGVAPSGTVAFFTNGHAVTTCAAVAVVTRKGITTASCKAPGLAFGPRVAGAAYSGDPIYPVPRRPASATYSVRYATTAALTAKKKVAAGTKVAIKVKVSHKRGKAAVAGTVTFTDNGKKLGKAKVTKGRAVLKHSLHRGKNKIVATYAGNTSYAPTSAKITVTAT